MKRTLTSLALAALAATAIGCNADALNGTDPNGNGNGDGGDGGMSGGDGGGFNTDAACGMVNAQATLAKAPVDIIMVIDNSGSMTQEITAVQNNINTSFAAILKASGLDYRVILISRHGLASNQDICIDAPLAGNLSCTPPPAKPTFTANFFQYSVAVASHNSMDLIISTYNKPDAAATNLAPNGWAPWLRQSAVKTFIEITDDNQANTYTAASFDTALRGLSVAQFGTAAKRNYIWHSIIGLKEKAVVTQAYLPTEAIVTTQCSTAAAGGNAGSVYQDLSIMTGGLRYPVCQTANYDAVFKTVAQGVVTGTTLACDFPVPAAPQGKTYILTTAQLKYTPGNGGAAQYFTQVSDMGQCAPNSFYIQGSQIYLCPSTCTTVQADSGAAIALALDCNSIIG